ncbi:MAG TPA: amino acid racemase [Paracoccaceae bacterium]|nr:amino acid racemase [Paracoccaceae bacterium]
MTAHIGIVGVSAEGAALCYRTICAEGAGRMGLPHAHPTVTMHTRSLADYVACLDRNDDEGVGGLMLDSAGALARAGADFLICPDNTVHRALPLVRDRSPLPWLHIAEVAAGEAARRGLSRLAILGTRWLAASDVYPDALAAHGVDFMRPEPEEQAEIDRIIMDELVPGIFRPGQTDAFRRILDRMAGAGCDGAMMACTEIPLVLEEGGAGLPLLDSTRLLARAALARAVA